ncbi:MAG: hypothetical protein ACI9W4_002865 [Rhodothermales bacterium]|jgi:hypothetical protein
MNDTIDTLHPRGKPGVNILRTKYDAVAEAITEAILEHEQIGFAELVDEVEANITGDLGASVRWYVNVVKLDLETRGVIERLPGRGPQKLRLVPHYTSR